MAVTVYYNNIDVFSGIGTVPLISRNVQNVYVNKVSHLISTFTLNGRIKRTDCVSGLNDPYTLSRLLCSRFSVGFKPFRVVEDGNNAFSFDYAIVRSINFSEDDWYDWIPYTITIDCFDEGYFDSSGIEAPTEQFSIDIRPDNTVQVTISVSCKGLNKGSQGFVNAKFYVENFAYSPNSLDFFWLENYSDYVFYQTNVQQSVNRLTGEASMVRTYIGQHRNVVGQYGVVTYSREMSISEDGEVTVVISGEEKGALGSDTSLFIVSDDIKNRDWYSIAQELYAQTNSGNLFVNPIRFSIDRNVSSESVSFSITFSNKQDNNVYVIDQTTITHDYEKSVNCIEASLSIRSNFGCHTSRWQNVQSYYQGLDFWQYINDRWREYGQTTSLNSRETSRSISENRYEGSITVSMTLCDNIGENCGCLQNLTYSLSFSPSIKQYSVSPTFGGRGCYYIEDLMASNRATFSVKGSVTPSPCCSIDQSLLQLQNRANQLANIYFAGSDKILETDSISEPSPRGELSFDFTWSADQSNIVPSDLL